MNTIGIVENLHDVIQRNDRQWLAVECRDLLAKCLLASAQLRAEPFRYCTSGNVDRLGDCRNTTTLLHPVHCSRRRKLIRSSRFSSEQRTQRWKLNNTDMLAHKIVEVVRLWRAAVLSSMARSLPVCRWCTQPAGTTSSPPVSSSSSNNKSAPCLPQKIVLVLLWIVL